MKLPVKTHISLDVLGARVIECLALVEREQKALARNGIVYMWQLLLFATRKQYEKHLRGMGRKRQRVLEEAMAVKGLRPGALSAYVEFWTQHVLLTLTPGHFTMKVQLFEVVAGQPTDEYDRTRWEQYAATLDDFRTHHTVHAEMRIDELFAVERNPLTPEQITFLRRRVVGELTVDMDEVDWAIRMRYNSVYQIAFAIGSMDRVSVWPPSVNRLRASLEAVLGPLPLVLSPLDFARIND